MSDRPATRPPGRVAGKVIVVTGAAGGQGAAEAAALGREGATVIAADRQAVPDGPGIAAVVLDVTEPEDWRSLASDLERRYGRVDGLVNNAGVASRVRLGSVALDEWNRVLAVNVTGPMLGIQALAPLMPSGSAIVNVGSSAGLTAHYTAAYTTSKWALRGLTHVAAMQYGARGIRVNAVHPGYFPTPMTEPAPEEFREAMIALTPLGRAGAVDEIAELMVFLMSDDCPYMSGAEIAVDGGYASGAGAKAVSDRLHLAGPAAPEA